MSTSEFPLVPIRWTRRFVQTDANQPVRTVRLIMGAIRKNQWMLLRWWRREQPTKYFPLKRSELEPMLSDVRPETSVAEGLGLMQLEASQTVGPESRKMLTGALEPQLPWLNRKVMLGNTGEPIAVGIPQQPPAARSRPLRSSIEVARDKYDDAVYSLETPEVEQEPRDYTIVRVFYATDRRKSSPPEYYSGRRCEQGLLKCGTCEVSIPRDHRIASLESPKWWRFEFSWNPSSYVQLLECLELPAAEFFDQLSGQVQSSPSSDCFVFIHGFNVSFRDAARRTAQVAYDLGFKGAPVLYSWPSIGTAKGYLADETTIEWTRPHLESFLDNLASRSGASTIHVIAHSMGNRALLKLLERLRLANHSVPQLKQIVLTAPDIDAEEFVQLASRLDGCAERLTLYASSNDLAIQASKKIHTYARAGEAGANIVVVKGTDTIDASAVDTSLIGHSYYADRRTVLSDLFYVIHDGKPPDERHGLEARSSPRGEYWAFRP